LDNIEAIEENKHRHNEHRAEAEKDCARVVVAVDLGVENLTSVSWGSDPKKS